MQDIIIVSISTLLFIVFIILNRYLKKKYKNPLRPMLIFPAIIIILSIGFSIYAYRKWQPFELLIDGENNKFIVTFPSKPYEVYIRDDVNAYKIIRNGYEFSLVYKKTISDDTVSIIAEHLEEKVISNDAQFIYREINEIDAYFIIYENKSDLYIFKKVVLYDNMFLDLTIQSSNHFPDKTEEAFLEYIIQ